MKNRKGSYDPAVPIITVVLLLGGLFFLIFPMKNRNHELDNQLILDERIVKTTDEFINDLFDNNSNKAGELSLGIVRFNILSNKLDTDSDFSIDNINSELNFASDNLAIVNSTVEYADKLKNEYDVVFYEVKLLKEEDIWKIYHLEEKDPSFNYDKKDVLLNNAKKNELKDSFSKYVESLSKGEYQKASQYLVGRAKKMHNKANPALNQLKLVNKITDLETNVIYEEEKIAVSQFNYINDNRPLSVLVYFYLTERGWRIYNVNQI